jgi:hypothetical protein
MASNGRAAPAVQYVRRNFDEAAILAVASKLAFEVDPSFSESEQATIAAMMRAHPQAGDSPHGLGEWLARMDDGQIQGVVSNTKGVLHEMEFVRLENEDGDAVYASLFTDTNHPSYDVQFVDTETGARWEAQLKATDNEAYVRSWMDAHPDGDIVVTDELASAMGVRTSGLDNEALTAKTEDVVDRLIEATDEDSLWNYFPALTAASIALVTWGLWQRYRHGDISLQRFKQLLARATGLKAGKLALLTLALSIPGLNVVTGAALVVGLLFSGAGIVRAMGTGRGSVGTGAAMKFQT